MVEIDRTSVSRKVSQAKTTAATTRKVVQGVVPVTPHASADLLPACLCEGYDP